MYREIWIRKETMLSRMFGWRLTERSRVWSLWVRKKGVPSVIFYEPVVGRGEQLHVGQLEGQLRKQAQAPERDVWVLLNNWVPSSLLSTEGLIEEK